MAFFFDHLSWNILVLICFVKFVYVTKYANGRSFSRWWRGLGAACSSVSIMFLMVLIWPTLTSLAVTLSFAVVAIIHSVYTAKTVKLHQDIHDPSPYPYVFGNENGRGLHFYRTTDIVGYVLLLLALTFEEALQQLFVD